jgi:hypothetical protein
VDEEHYSLATYLLDEDYEEPIVALCLHLGCDPSEVDKGRNSRYDHGNQTYIVATESEADELAEEYILDSLWAFNSEFLETQTGIPAEMFQAVQDQADDANYAVDRCIRKTCGMEKFIEEAVSADGRAHFLAHYDGEEFEEEVLGETYYIYREN